MEAYIETLSNWKALPIVAGSLESDAYGVEFKIPKGEVASIGGDRTCNFQVPHFLKNVDSVHCFLQAQLTSDRRRFVVAIQTRSGQATFVNGIPLPPNTWQNLQDGALVSLGGTSGGDLALKFTLYAPGSLESEFDRKNQLGKGAYGVVSRWQSRLLGGVYAVKQVAYSNAFRDSGRKEYKPTRDRVEVELRSHKALYHPNIVKLHAYIDDMSVSALNFVLEYAPHGSLDELIAMHGPFPEAIVRTIILQMALALIYMHEVKGMAHRDIKPQNTLVFRLKPKVLVKLSDFGFTRIITGQTVKQSLCGSPCYMAPEIVAEGKRYGIQVDSWSLGIMLFEMIAGVQPFTHHALVLIRETFQDVRKFDWSLMPVDANPMVLDLIRSLCEEDPLARLSARALLSHPWMNSST